ncbi:flavin reductase family protein [Mycobacterium sp. 3519A]|uniref:flavin reductase family protein n=1 Tax=Mycobacterium sp. 3519A TaxID=2057184 RepID=UPI000C7BB246|nr:flavin reductase family protein [Mycobacterium sp. 3519A]
MEAPDAAVYEKFARQLNYSMFIITTSAGAGLAGCLVGFASEISIHPPRFMAGLSVRNYTFEVAQRARHLAVHTVARSQRGLVELFGGLTGDEVNKFQRCSWHEGPHGMPILDDAAGWFVGQIVRRIVLGDHVGYVLTPVAGQVDNACEELVTLADVRDLTPGHEA